jgi:GTPase SAR1 family protein
MATEESMKNLARTQSVSPEVILDVAANNLRKSRYECEEKNPKFVADHAKNKLQEFNFVVCGAPRTGKSTLINAIINKDLAPTKSGPSAVTLETKCYSIEGNRPDQSDELLEQEAQQFRINIWDTKGITTWDKSIADIIDEKQPMCMILCSSPGSFAKDKFIRPLIDQCINLKIFIALVCTNPWNDSDEKRTTVMQELHDLLKVCYCSI